MGDFKFELGARLCISRSGEVGEVFGRCEYSNREPCYYLKYTDQQGCAGSGWLDESELERA